MKITVRTPKQLAKILRANRKLLGLTQKEVGDRVGLLPKTVSKLESAPESSEIQTLFKTISALQMELKLDPKQTRKLNIKPGSIRTLKKRSMVKPNGW